jgi:hypothetical protein
MRKGEMANKSYFFSTVSAVFLSFGLISTGAFGATVTLSDYLVTASPGRSWSYIYTHDTRAEADEFGGHLAGDEITVVDQPIESYILSILPPVVETGTLYLLEAPNIFLYFEFIDSLTVPAGTFNNVLAASALDSNFAVNFFNSDPRLAINPDIVTYGVTDADWFVAGVGQIKFLGVSAGDGSIDGGFELTGYTVPIPAAMWLFGSGLIGLIGIARRRKA